jgi:hypothetical protein
VVGAIETKRNETNVHEPETEMVWWVGLEVEGVCRARRLRATRKEYSEECLPLTLLVGGAAERKNSLNPR